MKRFFLVMLGILILLNSTEALASEKSSTRPVVTPTPQATTAPIAVTKEGAAAADNLILMLNLLATALDEDSFVLIKDAVQDKEYLSYTSTEGNLMCSIYFKSDGTDISFLIFMGIGDTGYTSVTGAMLAMHILLVGDASTNGFTDWLLSGYINAKLGKSDQTGNFTADGIMFSLAGASGYFIGSTLFLKSGRATQFNGLSN